jgi:hypothetical protein
MGKEPVVRPNRGSSLRPRAETPRRHFLYLDVTKEEQQKIRDYCVQRKISVSQFLAELVIKDATKSKPKRKEKVTIRAEFEVTTEEYEKLELLLRLRQKDSIGQFVSELLRPNLEIQRLHAPVETKPLRYYLSEEEHEIVSKYLASKGIAARNYGALLALKAIDKIRKKRK